jgi:hypothetical protein
MNPLTYLEPKPKGFVGRPFLATLFAVSAGTLGYHATAWLGIDTDIAPVLIGAIAAGIAYAWQRSEDPQDAEAPALVD